MAGFLPVTPEPELVTTDVVMVTVADAARMLSVSRALVYELAAAGVLERRFIGKRHFRIPVESLRAYVDSLPDMPQLD